MKMDGPSVVAGGAAGGKESLGSHDERPTTFCHRWKARTRPTLISTSLGAELRVPDLVTAIEPSAAMSPLVAVTESVDSGPVCPANMPTPLQPKRRLQAGHGTHGIAGYVRPTAALPTWKSAGPSDACDNFPGMTSACAVTNDTKAMGRYLRGLREQAGFSQRDLADRLDCHQPAIARLEAGGVSPNVETLRRIVEALGLRLELHAVSRSMAFNSGVTGRACRD